MSFLKEKKNLAVGASFTGLVFRVFFSRAGFRFAADEFEDLVRFINLYWHLVCIIYLVFELQIFNSCVVFASLCFQNMCFQLEAPLFMFLHTVPFTFVGVFAKSCMRRSQS